MRAGKKIFCILLLCLFLPGNAVAETVNFGTFKADVIEPNTASFINLLGFYNTTQTYNMTETDNEINMCMANITAESTYRQGNDTAILAETWTNVSLVNGSLNTEISDRQSADTTILSETWTNISNVNASLNTHTTDTGNPHTVTLAQLGAASSAQFTTLDASLTAHNTSTSNPHSVTLAQVGAAASSHTHVDADIPNDITINYAAVAGDADTVDGSHTGNAANKIPILGASGKYVGIPKRDITGNVVFSTTESGTNNAEVSTGSDSYIDTGKDIIIDLTNIDYMYVNYEVKVSTSDDMGIRLEYGGSYYGTWEGIPGTSYVWTSSSNIDVRSLTGSITFNVQMIENSAATAYNQGLHIHLNDFEGATS